MRMLDHLGRLGGVLIHPRRTFSRIVLAREGHMLELLPWVALVSVVVSPIEAGRALLFFRLSLSEGASALLMLLSSRMSPALAGVVVGAILLHGLEIATRSADARHGLDAAMDAVAFTIVPYLGLSALGMVLSLFGDELWWMPHHLVRGAPWVQAVRIAVGFGWSIALLGIVVAIFLTSKPKPPLVTEASAPR